MRCFVIVLIAGCFAAAAPASAEIIESIEAKINGELVFTSELDELMATLWMLNTGRPVDSMTREEYDELRARVLRERMKDILLSQECKSILTERGFNQRIWEREIEQMTEENVKKYRSQFDSEEAFQEHMQKNGLTEEGLRIECRQLARQEYWVKKVAPQLLRDRVDPPTEKEVEEFKEEHPEEWKQVEQIRVSHILLRVPDNASQEQLEANQARADTVALRAKSGEDFAKLAQELSEHDSTREDGGSLGWLKRNEVFPEFEQLFDLPVGEPTPPIQTSLGYHIVKVHERRSLKDWLYNRKLIRGMVEWIEEIIQRPETKIEYKGDLFEDLQADLEQDTQLP